MRQRPILFSNKGRQEGLFGDSIGPIGHFARNLFHRSICKVLHRCFSRNVLEKDLRTRRGNSNMFLIFTRRLILGLNHLPCRRRRRSHDRKVRHTTVTCFLGSRKATHGYRRVIKDRIPHLIGRRSTQEGLSKV